MNPAELKMVIELISKIGDDGKTAFIAYLFLNYGLSFISTVVVVSSICFLLYKIATLMYSYNRTALSTKHSLESDDQMYEAARHWALFGDFQGSKSKVPSKVREQVYSQVDKIIREARDGKK